LAQLSIVQFYNPDFLRGYGVGVLNGSLWTISVELQFYVMLPWVWTFTAYGRKRFTLALIAATLLANLACSLLQELCWKLGDGVKKAA
jgi:peptidoglycan/LPS O-acetylase OafA/YrhL